MSGHSIAEKILARASGKQEVFPGEEKISTKMWPEDKMKLHYTLDYIAP